MGQGRDKESESRGRGLGEAHAARRGVDVTLQEVVDGDVPGAREGQPVAAVPPVGVEAAVGEARRLREEVQHVLEDHQEHQQERRHEREEQPRDRLRQDERPVRVRGARRVECRVRFGQHRDDEVLARHRQQKDAAEDGERLVEELCRVDGLGARIFDLVAQRRAEEEVGEVEIGQVRRVRDAADRRGQFDGKVFAEGRQFAGIGARYLGDAIRTSSLIPLLLG